MASSREELIQYCLRKLGAPLVEINITEEQMDDVVEHSLSFYRDYYFDGIEKVYLKHEVTQEDIDNGYITLPDKIFGVNRVFPTNGATAAQTNIFDLQYQLRMNDFRDLTSTSMIYYAQMMQHMDLLDQLLNTYRQFRWNKLTNKLYLDQNWNVKDKVGNWILIDCYSALDPAEAPKFWNERSFKDHVTAALKQQWGANIKKFNGIQLPGGISLDGQAMYEEGKAEVEEIEQAILGKLSPLEFMMG